MSHLSMYVSLSMQQVGAQADILAEVHYSVRNMNYVYQKGDAAADAEYGALIQVSEDELIQVR